MIWRYNRDCTHRAGGGHSLSLPSPRAEDITRLSTLHHHVPGPLLKIVHVFALKTGEVALLHGIVNKTLHACST